MKHTLLLSAIVFAGITSAMAGPSESAAFAMRHAASQNAPAPTVVSSDAVKYVVTSNGKGGSVITQTRDTEMTSIALTKSSKGDSCSSCAKH